MARGFIGKAMFDIATIRALSKRLEHCQSLRYLCG